MRIIVDAREQAPFRFEERRFYEGVTLERGVLATGDYSLAGLSDRIAVERKSLDDLLGCLAKGRSRFEAELNRARGLEVFAVVVEAAWSDLSQGRYRSKMRPHAACQSVASFMVKYGAPFLFAGSRAGAEYLTWSVLHQFLDGTAKRFREIIRAHGELELAAGDPCIVLFNSKGQTIMLPKNEWPNVIHDETQLAELVRTLKDDFTVKERIGAK